MRVPEKLIFLPGVGGNPAFWQPVAGALPQPAARVLLGWPWFGAASPADLPATGARDMQDLVEATTVHMDRPCALIAQSMGGVVALLAALERPEWLTHLVLVATSGGVPIDDLHPEDWRPGFLQSNPAFPQWMADVRLDLSARLPSVQAPTLLLWGDADAISPTAVGQRLSGLLPHSQMHVLAGGGHDLAVTHEGAVAEHIAGHLQGAAQRPRAYARTA